MEKNVDSHTSKIDKSSSRRSTRLRNADTSGLGNSANNKSTPQRKKLSSEQSELLFLFDDSDDSDISVENYEGKTVLKKNSSRIDTSDDAENSILQPEDVSKVFKIISKPSNVTDQSDVKSGKSVLKTYCKQIDFPVDSHMIESFGLPDNPIVSDKTSLTSTIDCASIDASEITLLDVKFSDTPWEFTNVGEHSEEIRFKEHPQKPLVSPDNLRNEDIEEDEYIFTSTPRIKSNKEPKKNRISVAKRKVLNEKICDQLESGKRSNNHLVHYNSLSHENEEVEIFNASRFGKNSESSITDNEAGYILEEENIDREIDIILSKKHASQSKKLLKSLDIGIDFKPEEPFETTRRVLRSKSSLDLYQDVNCRKSPSKQKCRPLKNKWLSVSQDDISQSDRIKKSVLNKSLPQLKVVLSSIDISARKDDSGTEKPEISLTRKSLRSYKLANQEDGGDNLDYNDISCKLSEPIDIIEASETSNPQVFGESIADPQSNDQIVLTSSEVFQEFLNNYESNKNGLSKNHVKLCQEVLKKSSKLNEKSLVTLANKNPPIDKNENNDISEILEAEFVAKTNTVDENNQSKAKIHKDLSMQSCDTKPKTGVDNFESNVDPIKVSIARQDEATMFSLTRKSLRSYKVPNKVGFEDNSNSNDGSGISKQPAQIFDDNSSSLDSIIDINRNNNTVENNDDEQPVSTSCEMFEEFLNSSGLNKNGLLKNNNKLCPQVLKVSSNNVSENACNEDDKIIPVMNNENSICSKSLENSEVFTSASKNVDENFPEICVLNNKSQLKIHKADFSKNSVISCDTKPKTVINHFQSNTKIVKNRVQKSISTSQKKRIRRPRKRIQTIENCVTTISPTIGDEKMPNSFGKTDELIKYLDAADTKLLRKSSRHNKLVIEDKKPNIPTICNQNELVDAKPDITKQTKNKETPLNISSEVCTEKPPSIVEKRVRQRNRKHTRKIKPLNAKNESTIECMNDNDIIKATPAQLVVTKSTGTARKHDEPGSQKIPGNIDPSSKICGKSARSRSRKKEGRSASKIPENLDSDSSITLSELVKVQSKIPANLNRARRKTPRKLRRPRKRPKLPLLAGIGASESRSKRSKPRKIKLKSPAKHKNKISDGAEEIVCKSSDDRKDISSECAFDSSQNTIADLVKKRSRSPKNYKLVKCKSLGKRSAHELSKRIEDSFEDLLNISASSSEVSIDNTHSEEPRIEQSNISKTQANIDTYTEVCNVEENQSSIKENSVQSENDKEEIEANVDSSKSDEANVDISSKMLEKQPKEINNGESENEIHYQSNKEPEIVSKETVVEISIKKNVGQEKIVEKHKHNHIFNEEDVANRNDTVDSCRYSKGNEFIDANIKTNNSIVKTGDAKKHHKNVLSDKWHLRCSSDEPAEEIVQEQNDKAIEDSIKEFPNQTIRLDNIDGEIGFSSLLTENHALDECPSLSKYIEDTDDEDEKDSKKVPEVDYDTEDEIVMSTSDQTSHRHVLRSRTSLGERIQKKVTEDATTSQKSKPRRSSFDQARNDIDNINELKGCQNIEQSLRYSNKVRLLDTEMVKDIRGHLLDFKVGNIAWAKIGSYPFWPCLVTKEPSTEIYIKNVLRRNSPRVSYHVIFFGDRGRRAWISKQRMMVYKSKEDLNEIRTSLKKENKHSRYQQLYSVKAQALKNWLPAVDEAELVKLKPIEERLSFFDTAVLSHEVVVIKEEEPSYRKRPRSPSKNQESSVRKKQKLLESPAVEESPNKIVERKKPVKKTVEIDLTEESTSAKDDLNESKKKPRPKSHAPKDKLSSPCASSPPTETKIVPESPGAAADSPTVAKPEHLDASEEVEANRAEPHNLSTFFCESIEAQEALFKRNNLFRGVSKEKVCQYCFGPGDVLKCKGCNAVYHAGCAVRVLQELVVPRKRSGFSLLKSESVVDESRIKMESEVKESDSKETNVESDDEDHVQIITVPSSVYNTPPRKTFPPNFQNLTLAEQIDFKMKEVMKKFESRTTYAESPTETSSEDSSGLPRRRSFSRSHILFPPVAKKKRNSSGLPKPLLPKHVTADLAPDQTLSSESDDLPDKPKSRKPATRHVTADCASFEPPDSENSNSNFGHQSTGSKRFRCGFCVERTDPYCFVCHQDTSKRGSGMRHKCSLYQCSRFYHSECLKLWPQTQWSLIQTSKHRYSQEEIDSFVCPQHVCHTCVSDDPRAATSRCSGDKIVKCQLCPSTYHSTNLCVPAGTDILSSTQIICPRHRAQTKAAYTINTTWCFLCSQGGALICCETCPTSVHPECAPHVDEHETFVCEECESGRLPLHDEIVWVKLGSYRWWPALVLFPGEVPARVAAIKHRAGEFVVKFFGTYDHYWVNRGRSFLFQEGDAGDTKVGSQRRKAEQVTYKRAVEEAVVVHKLKQEFKLKMEVEALNSQKPPPYIKIKVNKPVGNVRLMELDLSSTTACECDPKNPNPCGPESDCLNRLLWTECNPEACPAGQRCGNQSFDKREYPPMIPYKTQGRGWGLKSLAAIKRGQFVIEYVGEIIDDEEYQRRIQKMHEQKEENYYFLTIDKDRMIDAGPKGNMARFMNHCCQPNCETQKWTVNGDTKVGLFATADIPAETELTFNYNLECSGKEKKICRCGAPNCSGFIGVKAKQDAEVKKPKKTYKKKEPAKPLVLPPCFICKRRGDVGACNNKMCNKAFHLKCLNLTEWPEGNKYVCPWHNCNTCSKRTIRCCVKCLNSFCPSHSEGNVRYDHLLGFVCNYHDPSKPGSEKLPITKRRKVVNDDTAVSSTTPDDFPNTDSDDDVPLAHRGRDATDKNGSSDSDASDRNEFAKHEYRRRRVRKADVSDSDEDFVLDTEDENDRSLDETVSSVTASDYEEEVRRKRKRRKSKKSARVRKRSKLEPIPNPVTANENDINNVNSGIGRHAIDSK